MLIFFGVSFTPGGGYDRIDKCTIVGRDGLAVESVAEAPLERGI